MAKHAAKPTVDVSEFDRSTFTLTFAIEILGIDLWQDCNGGCLELGTCTQGLKIQYQLYPGQNFDVEILIWPQVAKIWRGMNSGWVRTWQFLDRRWLAFDISHMFPVRALDLQMHVATITPIFGLGGLSANAKNDKVNEVFLPPLEFGQQRYFASVIAEELSLETFIHDLIWKTVKEYIPESHLDGLFDVPHAVTEVRHQDAVLRYVKDSTLNRNLLEETTRELSSTSKRGLSGKQKPKADAPKTKYEIILSGDTILAGIGRQTTFEAVGSRPPELGDMFVSISSQNLPASDDYPILFINIGVLSDVPVEALKKYNISYIYTRWSIGNEVHVSLPQYIDDTPTFNINDNHALPLPYDEAFKAICGLADDDFRIQLRGIRQQPRPNVEPVFFGYDKRDRLFGTNFPSAVKKEETDIIIAATKIDVRVLSTGVSSAIQGEFPLFPPTLTVDNLNREHFCTNDHNAIRQPVNPEQIVPSYVILDAQMTLEVRMGYAGCRPHRLNKSYSRMICLVTDSWLIHDIIEIVNDINNDIEDPESDEYLSGFALDTGPSVIFYVEGPKDGAILRLWDTAGDYFPHTKPVFTSSAKYATRVYPKSMFARTKVCFMTMKMFVPLSAVLACPPIYTKPGLPILARFAALKIGRLLSTTRWWRLGPPNGELPTFAEISSFRQELCVAPRPPNAMQCGMLLKQSVTNDNLCYVGVKPSASISVLRQKIWHLLDLPDFCEEVIILKSNDGEIPLTELRKGNDPQKPFILEVWPPKRLQTFKPNMLTMGTERSSVAASIAECEHMSQGSQDIKDVESIQTMAGPIREVTKSKQKRFLNTLPPEYKNSDLSCKISSSSIFFKLPNRKNRDNFGNILLKIQDDLEALSEKLSTLEDKIKD